MRNFKVYEPSDKLIGIIGDNYNVLQMLGGFGISLGFRDKTVEEVCRDNNVDCGTFLALVNFTANGVMPSGDTLSAMSVPTLMRYLKASHKYYLDFQLPYIRRALEESVDPMDKLGLLILNCYDDYAREIQLHMHYEEAVLFPYVDGLLAGVRKADYDIDEFEHHSGRHSHSGCDHERTARKLRELKNIIIRYLPSDPLRNNQMVATLYNIFNNEEWLALHYSVEEKIFVPAIKALEARIAGPTATQGSLSERLAAVAGEADEPLSEREKDVIRGVVQGLSNKEIASRLFISLNTVLTHRRNIARKLQIHSPAGLTIYAIVNGIVEL